MKRKCCALLVVCMGLFMLSCHNGKENTPESAVKSFAAAFYTGDFAHMYEFSTQKSHPVVEALQNGMKGNEARLEEMKNSKVEFVEVKVLEETDSTALCGLQVKIDERPRQDQWDVVKENGTWKVSMVVP